MLDVSTTRIRRGIARRADALLGALRLVEPRAAAREPAVEEPRTPFSAAGPARPRPVEPAPEPEPRGAAPADDVVGPAITAAGDGLDYAEVQEILDEMVRPALQSDGGDITLVRVEGGDVYVQLVGACSSCPSSVLTMKMGIERLLEEELPAFRRLVQINA